MDMPTGQTGSKINPGKVWLVGAGPGDPGLLTLHAVNALQSADYVIYDSLVDCRILELARPEAKLEFAGKRGGKPSTKQRDITKRLIELALSGQRVLRLKGGDPFVFGRGAEEALALKQHGITFRIVPGVTAGIGGLAYAGIPVTHRETNHAVTFVTGHNSGGDVPDSVDWQMMASSKQTIVMYMALKHFETIAARLIGFGRSPDEAVAFVSRASTADQHVVISTLADGAEAIHTHKIEAPAVIVVGPVVNFHHQLDWLAEQSQTSRDKPRLVAV